MQLLGSSEWLLVHCLVVAYRVIKLKLWVSSDLYTRDSTHKVFLKQSASTLEKNHGNVKQRSLKPEQSVFSPKSRVAMKKGATSVCHEDDPLKQEMGLFPVVVVCWRKSSVRLGL